MSPGRERSFSWNLKMVLSMIGMFTLGSFAVINQKFLFESKGYGKTIYGYHRWRKPWFFTTGASVGMMAALIIYYVRAMIIKEPTYQLSWKQALYAFVPSFLDLSSSALSNISVLYLNVSVVVMLRGSTVMFASLLSKFWLKRNVYLYQWIAIAIVLSALVVVAASAVLSHKTSDYNNRGKSVSVPIGYTVVGIIIKVASKFFQSFRLIIEEDLTQVERVPSVLLVGVEGVWCTIMTGGILLPLVNNGPGPEGNGLHEDFVDACLMLGNNRRIAILFCVHVLLMIGLTISAMIVIETTDAVFRTLFDLTRVMFIWVIQLILHYAMKGKEIEKSFGKIGEPWTPWSWLQLGGFAMLFVGMLVYSKVIRLQCINYPGEYQAC